MGDVVETKNETGARSRRGDTRERLLAAARELFVERGFHATRPQDISRAAGVGHGTFYLHFKDKQACFLAFAEQAAAELDAYLESIVSPDAPPLVSIRDTIRGTFEFSEANPGVIAAALTDLSVIDGGEVGSILMERWGDEWARRIAEWKDKGFVAAHIDAEYVGQAIPGMLRQTGGHAARTEASIDRLVDGLMPFIAVGLGLQQSGENAGQAGDTPA